MIYNYCLLTSVVINPLGAKFGRQASPYFTEFITSTEKPTGSLLGVSTLIREEASPIFFGKNLLILPWDSDHPTAHFLWVKHNAHFRPIMINFEFHRLTDHCHGCASPYFSSFDHRSREDLELLVAHNSWVRDLLDKWEKKWGLVKDMKLKSLVIDMTDCWCPLSCCRLVKKACEEVLRRHLLPKRLRANPNRLCVIRLADTKTKYVGVDTEEKAFIRGMGLSN